MPDPFIGEIRIFTGDYAPDGWALCNGQLLSISQNTALFSILGTSYGGNGTTTFALPNLIGRAPLHQGSGPGLTPRAIGEPLGESTVTLTNANLPSHAHLVAASAGSGSSISPVNGVWAASPSPGPHKQPPAAYALTPNSPMNQRALTKSGNSYPHNNMQPYLAVNFIIALKGLYPSRDS